MKLIITERQIKDLVDDTQCLSTSMLAIKSTHLFIASNKWSEVLIEINDIIPRGSLKWISKVCDNVKVALPNEITATTFQLLIDLFSNKVGELRKCYLQGGDVKEVLKDEIWTDLQKGVSK